MGGFYRVCVDPRKQHRLRGGRGPIVRSGGRLSIMTGINEGRDPSAHTKADMQIPDKVPPEAKKDILDSNALRPFLAAIQGLKFHGVEIFSCGY